MREHRVTTNATPGSWAGVGGTAQQALCAAPAAAARPPGANSAQAGVCPVALVHYNRVQGGRQSEQVPLYGLNIIPCSTVAAFGNAAVADLHFVSSVNSRYQRTLNSWRGCSPTL